MAKRLLIGGGNFSDLIRKGCLFVDKSGIFIPKILEDGHQSIVITRPRRWGKTLNMSMLHHFLSPRVHGMETKGLFDELEISKIPGDYIAKYQGKSPVIFLTFKDFKVRSYEDAIEKLKTQLYAAVEVHKEAWTHPDSVLDAAEKDQFSKYLSKDVSNADLEDALRIISKLLYKHTQNRVYILIDEYDTPLNYAFTHQGSELFEPLSELLKNFFSAGMKDNPYLEKGVMTGILRVSKDSMLSGLNNIETYTVLNDERYDDSFGFTQEDLIRLFEDQGLSHDEPAVQAWYNGYQINGLTLYNPWSIMNCLAKKGKLQPYWVLTSDDMLLRELIHNSIDAVKEKLGRLLLGEQVEVFVSETMRFDEIRHDDGMLWNLLVLGGYLKVLGADFNGRFYAARVAIPNQEILLTYQGIFSSLLVDTSETLTHQTRMLSGLIAGDLEKFRREIQYFLESAASVHDYATQPEAFYHGFTLALLASIMDRFYVFSNSESGYGRPDVILIPKDKSQHRALILEFKIAKPKENPQQLASKAIKQIKVEHYAARIQQYDQIHEILMVGVVFKGKTVYCLSEKANLE